MAMDLATRAGRECSSLRRPYKDVTDAPHRPDAPRLPGAVAHFLPQVRDVDVEGAIDARVVGPSLGQNHARQLLPRDGFARPASEHDEDAKFKRRQLKLTPPERRLVRGRVDRQVAHMNGA